MVNDRYVEGKSPASASYRQKLSYRLWLCGPEDDPLRVKKRMRCNLVHGVGWWALNCACSRSQHEIIPTALTLHAQDMSL
ncbi:hypothetical protein I308_101094 [Cryptococcus tetragattii IND107]|uniref:Uncharacterized protein n=1 Tax=Cryptococcus tetragattii IND107 TaxID=1296105 RepID=A0ABR3BZA3_9TREE